MHESYASLMSVFGLRLICKQADVEDMARLHTYVRVLKLACVDAGPQAAQIG